jgi:hypothetical protein
MVGKMPFEQMQLRIDRTDQPGVPRQMVEGAYGTTVNRSNALGHLILDVPSPKHRLGLCRPLSSLKAFSQILFPFSQNSGILVFHSKLLSLGFAMFVHNALYPIKTGVSSFLMGHCQSNHA